MNTRNVSIRPFTGLTQLEKVFDTTVMRFGPDFCRANERIHADLTAHEFLLRHVLLEWTPDGESFSNFQAEVLSGIDKGGIDTETVELVVIAKSSYLKLSDVVFRWPVLELGSLPRQIDLTEKGRARVFSAPHSGFGVGVFLLLSRHLTPRPLKPFRKGTWLSRTQFGVDTVLSHVVFPPLPLTPEIRSRLGLSPKATRYVDLDVHDVTEDTEEQPEPRFYIDEDLLAQLNVRRGSAVSRAFQTQLAFDFLTSVVRSANKKSELAEKTYDMVRSSLIGAVVRIITGGAASESQRDEVIKDVISRPEKVIANLEHVFDVSKRFIDALRESEDQ